jgi:[glutamine synthetase] adenylyltransferase / [glutamine synthetase]-adenylyl-L-tyrosine phosphorylase
VPRPILKRLATVAGLPSAKALLGHLDATRKQVRAAYGRLLRPSSDGMRGDATMPG